MILNETKELFKALLLPCSTPFELLILSRTYFFFIKQV